MQYVVGVDGGGSQTTAALAELSGRLVAVGRSGGANHQGPGIEVAVTHIREAIDRALGKAGVSPRDIVFTHYGLAGADRDRDFRILRKGLSQLPFERWDVVSDAWEGLRAGTEDYVGVSVVCGSGTNAVGRNAQGDKIQVGGMGYEFGDGAGGNHLATETFRSAVRDYQRRGPKTALATEVPRHLGFSDMDGVYNHFLDYDTDIPLDLAILAHRVAEDGDAVAQSLLQSMGEELGVTACAVLDHLQHPPAEPIPLVLVGSVLQRGRSPYLLNPLKETVKARYPGVRMRALDAVPVFGSVLLALDCLNEVADPAARRTFQNWEE